MALTNQCSVPLHLDLGSGLDDTNSGSRPIVYCPYAARPPSPPEGGYDANAITSCAGLTVVDPPDALATQGCSPGWSLQLAAMQWTEIYLCPTGITVPGVLLPPLTPVSADVVQGIHFAVSYQWYPNPENGCFGQSAFAGYEYLVRNVNDTDGPSNCSGGCAHF
jgi:hypothetical protein